jgi:hypothetical protein
MAKKDALHGNPRPLSYLSQFAHWLLTRAERQRLIVGGAIIFLSALPWIHVLTASDSQDVGLYREIIGDLLSGKLPYRDRVLEYPPYALAVFIVPAIFGIKAYADVFILWAAFADSVIRSILLLLCCRNSKRATWFLPLLVYCVSALFLHGFFLIRYDIFPALVTLFALFAFTTNRYVLAGALVALGTGIKLYPILFAPPLFLLALRSAAGGRFAAGLATGFLPIAVLSFFLPWWKFLTFHSARGLQVESLYASILWLGHKLGLLNLKWTFTKAWFEIQGEAVDTVLPCCRLLFASGVCVSVLFVSWAAMRCRKPSASSLARLLLVPLLAFMVFNQVLSPQYMIWLLPFAAVGILAGKPVPGLLIAAAAGLTPLVYPTEEYHGGLGLPRTLALVARNLLLLLTWIWLVREILHEVRQPVPIIQPSAPPEKPESPTQP